MPSAPYWETVTADFYVDADRGDDANSGGFLAPVETLAQAQSLLTANKSVALRRGCRWQEALTIPANGITVKAYGEPAVFDDDRYDEAGRAKGYCTNAPVIDGGQYVTGWEPYIEGTTVSDSFTDVAGTNLTAHTPETGSAWTLHPFFPGKTMVITADGKARRGTSGAVTYYANPSYSSSDYAVSVDATYKSVETGDLFFVLARIGNTDAERYYALALTTTEFKINKWNPTSSTISNVYSHSPVVGQTYSVRLEVEGTTLRGYLNGVLRVTATDSALTGGRAGLKIGSASSPVGGDSLGWQADNFTIEPVGEGVQNIYQAPAALTPRLVAAFGEYAFDGASIATLADRQYRYSANVLYLRSDAGQPSETDVVTNARNNCISAGASTDVTIENVGCEHSRDRAITSTGDRITVRRVGVQRASVGYSGDSGTYDVPGALNLVGNAAVVEECVIRDVGNDGIWLAGRDATVSRNKIGPTHEWGSDGIHSEVVTEQGSHIGHTVTNNMFTQEGSNTTKGAVILFGDDHVVTDNVMLHANWAVIILGDDSVISRNFGYDISGYGIAISNHAASANIANAQIDRNVMVECGKALYVKSDGTGGVTGLSIGANTFANAQLAPTAALVHFECGVSGLFKDNIVWNAGSGTAYNVATVLAGGWDSDYNVIGPERAAFVSYTGGSHATLAAYRTASSKDANSIKDNPLFVNLGGAAVDGSDYELQAGSPAVLAGTTIPDIVTAPTNIGAK